MFELLTTQAEPFLPLIRVVLIFIVGYGCVFFVHKFLKKYLLLVSNATLNRFDDLLASAFNSIGWPIYIVAAYNFVILFEDLPLQVLKIGYILSIVLVSIYLAYGVQNIVIYLILKLFQKDQTPDSRSLSQIIGLIIQVIIWSLAVILIFQNLGVNINALIGTLGIGGIAVAFALQNILSDIFASFSIYLDRPFIIGDFIQVGKDLGTVEKVGLRSTRIKTLQGEEMIFSNKELLNARIQNFNNFTRRRVEFHLPVSFNTLANKLENIPTEIQAIVSGIKLADFDRCHWKEFGTYKFDFEIVYFVNSSDYRTYMDIQQQINLQIKYYLEKEEIELAYLNSNINETQIVV